MALSSAQLIEDSIQRSTYGFSAVDTMGDLVGNKKFKSGYEQFKIGQHTRDSYVWEVLSAASQSLGQEVYSNVLHYIDNVSNVDTCKVSALKSMLQLVGVNYLVLDKLHFYPIEVQRLIDILSMNKKHLFNNKFMMQSFIDDLSASGTISAMPNLYDATASGNMSSSLDYYIYDQSTVDKYLSSTFYNFIYDMMDMFIVPDDQISSFIESLSLSNCTEDSLKAYSQIQPSDGYGPNATLTDDKYAAYKKMSNIDVDFDVAAEVDKIEIGQSSLDDYYGDELTLLTMEIDNRRSALAQISSSSVFNLMARNAYYRKKKVIEYAKFVDNLVGVDSGISAYQTYDYDPSYYLNPYSLSSQTYSLTGIGTQEVGIVSSSVAAAAKNLVLIVNYIAKIREVVRQQVRKIFMKGTNNLLEYTVNEFLIDYANQLEQTFPKEQVSAVVARLSAHSINGVKVQEYWDNTEYFNISAVTSDKYALNYKTVNDRYFDETFSKQGDVLVPREDYVFTNDEINDFYLSTLGMKNSLGYAASSLVDKGYAGLSSNFYDFLSVLFDIAADSSYYDAEYNVFGSKLSNQIITHDIHGDLQLIKEVSAVVMSAAAKADYEFSGLSTIRQQKDALFEKLASVLQEEYLSAISSTYDQYYPQVQQISTEFDSKKNVLSTYLNSTYASYFCQSTNSYSYINGKYQFPYFIGNSNYLTDDYFIVTLDQASNWINENCHTYALSNAIDQLSSEYDTISGQIQRQLVDHLVLSGFIDLHLDNLADQMDTVKSFLNQKISSRTQYLQQALENFRSQANQLKSTYDSCEASFQQIASQMVDTSQGWYMTWVGTDAGGYARSSSPDKTKESRIYDNFSQGIYAPKAGPYNRVEFNSNNDISKDALLIDNVNRAIRRVTDEVSKIYFGFTGSTGTTTRPYGTQKDALNAINSSIIGLGKQINNILNQVQQAYQIDATDPAFTSMYVSSAEALTTDYNAKILALIEYLGTNISEAEFAKDLVLYAYNSYFKDLTNISAEYIPTRNEYEVLWTKFGVFLQSLEKTSDYKVFNPGNLDRLDKYRRETDATALARIQRDFDELRSSYAGLVDEFVQICAEKVMLYRSAQRAYAYEYTGDVLEECLTDFESSLLKDIAFKEEIGYMHVDADLEHVASNIDVVSNGERAVGKVGLYKKYFSEELVPLSASYSEYEIAFDSQYVPFTGVMDKLYQLLDYSSYGSFKESMLMFKNYTGITASKVSADQLVADDPYYNHKNLSHPSFQIHPFLWNFTEKNVLQMAVDTIAAAYANIDVDALEGSQIAFKLDQYLGQFGNSVSVWNNNVRDFTSYTTRYEQSTHVCRYTNTRNEMVDYDGAFYPPALEEYSSPSTLLDDFIANYYSHLNIDVDENAHHSISASLVACKDAILSTIASTGALSSVHDIFKYELDAYGNMYILYKKYSQKNGSVESMTYAEKLHTPGRLWIRLCDSPIAFPIEYAADLASSAKITVTKDEEVDHINISDVDIYDFEILPTGYKICIAYIDSISTNRTGQMQCIPFHIQYKLKTGCGIGSLTFLSKDPESGSEYQMTTFPRSVIVSTSKEDGSMLFNRYLGMCTVSPSQVDALFIQCRACPYPELSTLVDESTMSIPDRPTVLQYVVDAQKATTASQATRLNGISGIVANDPPIAYYDSTFNIAFLLSCSIDSMQVVRKAVANEQTSISTDLSVCPNGWPSTDPLHNDMNSFDVFNQKVVVASLDVSSKKVQTTSQAYQTNADIGYTPSYAGLSGSGPLDLRESIVESHQAIELLGKSKDLDGLASSMHASPDPYLTKQDICSKYLFGRAWENGAQQLSSTKFQYDQDSSLALFSCKSFYQNMPTIRDIDNGTGIQTVQSFQVDSFYWKIDMGSIPLSDLCNYKVFMYNTKSLGKNPYLVKDLSSMLEDPQRGKYQPVDYNEISDYQETDLTMSSDNYRIKVSGTQNGIDEVDYTFSNNIADIDSIQYRLADNSTLVVKMHLVDYSKPTFIEKDSLKLALINVFDIKFFEWFHLLDEGTTYENAIEELGRVKGTPFSKDQMLAVDLADYTALSDVQIDGHRILDSYRKMAFKLDESDVFPLSSIDYYVPSLNIKYPLTMAQAYDEHNITSSIDLESLVKVFNPDEVFVLDMQDADVLSSIQQIVFQLDRFNIQDEIRVYEDYLDYDLGLEEYNEDKFPLEDPQFYQYAHFYGTDVPDGGIQVPTSAVNQVEVLSGEESDAFTSFIEHAHLSAGQSEEFIDGSYIEYMFDWQAIDQKQKAIVINQAAKFLKVYMNYKKSSSGIVLYANYQNFLNTPFLKVEAGRVYADTIEGTYAKVLPGESQRLDIVVQFRQYANTRLVSYKNMVAASYQIYNVSDDKPKFVIKKLSDYAVLVGEQTNHTDDIYAVAQQYVGMSTQQYVRYAFSIDGVDDAQTTVECIATYPKDLLSVDTGSLDVDQATILANGTLKIAFDSSKPVCLVDFVKTPQFTDQNLDKELFINIVDAYTNSAKDVVTENGYICLRQTQ